jgi:hypothetical protein
MEKRLKLLFVEAPTFRPIYETVNSELEELQHDCRHVTPQGGNEKGGDLGRVAFGIDRNVDR